MWPAQLLISATFTFQEALFLSKQMYANVCSSKEFELDSLATACMALMSRYCLMLVACRCLDARPVQHGLLTCGRASTLHLRTTDRPVMPCDLTKVEEIVAMPRSGRKMLS